MKSATTKAWKGIVLAGGKGTRLYPMTLACSKQLLPVYNKPMIYYPISTLMLGGIRDIMIISTPHDLPRFEELLGDGSELGVKFSYKEQDNPNGIAEAFLLAADFIDDSPVTLILGDNLFYGDTIPFRRALERTEGATIFAYPVRNPTRYGVVEVGPDGRAISIEEKPSEPKSNLAVPGLYCYSSGVVDITKGLVPSDRGELEITDLNRLYMDAGQLYVEVLRRGIAWLDAGTPQSLLEASGFVGSIERRQGMKIGCLEEVAFRMGHIDATQLRELSRKLDGTEYGEYLAALASEQG